MGMMGAQTVLNDERIPNLVSIFKWNKIWPPFLQKKKLKIGEIYDMANFQQFFLSKKGAKCYLNFILGLDLVSSYHLASFYAPVAMNFTLCFFTFHVLFE